SPPNPPPYPCCRPKGPGNHQLPHALLQIPRRTGLLRRLQSPHRPLPSPPRRLRPPQGRPTLRRPQRQPPLPPESRHPLPPHRKNRPHPPAPKPRQAPRKNLIPPLALRALLAITPASSAAPPESP